MRRGLYRTIVSLAVSVVASTHLGLQAGAQEYDVVILKGRVIDPETMFDSVRNISIKDGKIITITEGNTSGKETIDATGHVVALGFTSEQGFPI